MHLCSPTLLFVLLSYSYLSSNLSENYRTISSLVSQKVRAALFAEHWAETETILFLFQPNQLRYIPQFTSVYTSVQLRCARGSTAWFALLPVIVQLNVA